jgi:hypothetical protein
MRGPLGGPVPTPFHQMNVPPRTVAAIVAIYAAVLVIGLAAGACDPASWLRVQQGLRPVPTPDCVDSALKSSPRVLVSSRTYTSQHDFGFDVTVSDSLGRAGRRYAQMAVKNRQDSVSQVSLSYSQMGGGFSSSEKRDMETIGREVLTSVRTRCAPQSDTTISCVNNWGPWRGKPCRAAA